MAQTGFMLSDEGKTFSVTNDSSTTAIYAGDIVYSATNNDKFTGTAARARAGYALSDVLVKSISCSATAYKTAVGVALEDIPASGVGAVSTEGIWLHPALIDTEAGDALMAGTTTDNKVQKIPDVTAGSTTTNATATDNLRYNIGKALTGGSTDGKYILWKLNI